MKTDYGSGRFFINPNAETVDIDPDTLDWVQIKPLKTTPMVRTVKQMRLKHGKKYETADGTVYMVLERETKMSFEVSPSDYNQWTRSGFSMSGGKDLIRRHYTKPQPANKLDLKPGDVVELVAWEDGCDAGAVGKTFDVGLNGPETDIWEFNQAKGERPLFRVVSRASWTKPPS